MKTQTQSNKDGGILLMAMLIVLLFSALAVGLFKLQQVSAVETVSVEKHRRAFWMAEAGLEKAYDWFANNKNFRDDPDAFVPTALVTITNGAHATDSFRISSVTTSPSGTTGTLYTVTAVGYSGNLNRRLQQTIVITPGGGGALSTYSAISGGDSDITLAANVYIDGDVYIEKGDLNTASKENLNSVNPTGIDGYAALQDGDLEGKGAASVDTIDAPMPPEPTIEMTYWQPYLDLATPLIPTNGLAGASNIFINVPALPYNFTIMEGDTKLNISGTASGQNGFHYMVSATDTIFSQWLTLMDNTIIVVEGDVTFQQNFSYFQNCVIFATGDINIQQASDAGGTGVALIAQGDVNFAQNMTFHGLVYAEGTIDVGSNSEIIGSLKAKEGINIGSNTTIKEDDTVFLNPIPGVNNLNSSATLRKVAWSEIAPE